MNVLFHRNSVFTAQRQMCKVAEEIGKALVAYNPILDELGSLEQQIKLIHRGVKTIILAINAPLDEFVSQGLRATNEAWENPPMTSRDALDEVERLLIFTEPWINLRNGRRILIEHSILFLQFEEAINYFQSLYYEEFGLARPYVDFLELEESAPSPQQQAVTQEQIARLPVHVATDEHTDQKCTICLENYVAGQEVKTLPCHHQFHDDCNESWLRESGTCPVDRCIVFTD